jgi:hypothetical protein
MATTKQRDASALGKMKRRKGSSYEREIATMLKVLWPEARRGIGQARNAGEVPDVDGTPYWVEAKNHKRAPNVHAAYAQAIEAQAGKPSKRPVLVVSRKTGDGLDLATLPLRELLLLLEALTAVKKTH